MSDVRLTDDEKALLKEKTQVVALTAFSTLLTYVGLLVLGWIMLTKAIPATFWLVVGFFRG